MNIAPAITPNTAANFADLVNQIVAYDPEPDYLVCVDFMHDQLRRMVRNLEWKRTKAQRDAECRERAAYHEAAHVIASWAMGFRSVGAVQITETGQGSSNGLGRELEGTPRHLVARHVVISLAGDAGEIVKFGSTGYCDYGDIEDAERTIEGGHPIFLANRGRDTIGNAKRRVSRYERRLKAVAERTLRAHWPAVEALASKLLGHTSLTAMQVRKCVRPHFESKGRAR